MKSLQKFLKIIPFVEELEDGDIGEIASLFHEKTYKKGKIIFLERRSWR